MRVSKFKGKDKAGNWHFGDVLHHDHGVVVIVDDAGKQHKIIPQTRCEFTGFKDIVSKEIFEGDIIQNTKHSELVYKVKMIDGCWCSTMNHDCNSLSLCWLLEHSYQKVIGNIHDND